MNEFVLPSFSVEFGKENCQAHGSSNKSTGIVNGQYYGAQLFEKKCSDCFIFDSSLVILGCVGEIRADLLYAR